MRQKLSLFAFIACAVILLSACHSMPDHAKYLPKNAVGVLSVDVESLGKKVAWNAITGSKIFDEWKARPQDKDAMKSMDNAGIDFLNTIYLYNLPDERFSSGQRVTAIIPMDDEAKWEAFLKKTFSGLQIRAQGDRKEALLSDKMYAGWDKKVLIVMNTLQPKMQDWPLTGDAVTDTAVAAHAPVNDPVADMATLSAEMSNAFNVSKDNMLKENKRFASLQKEGHDISVWVNYDVLMSGSMSKNLSNMTGGIALSNTLWKDAAFTSAIDFKKGAISSDMKYYMPDALADIAKEMAAKDVDKELMSKLPAKDLDMVAGWHLSMKAIKDIMDKMGVAGLANLALSAAGLSIDEIGDAFTGDMGFAMNNFSVEKQMTASAEDSSMTFPEYKHKMYTVYVLKINKKENVAKLLQMAVKSEMLHMTANNTYTLGTGADQSITIVTDDKYIVISNKLENATAYLQSKGSSDMPKDASDAVHGHPMGMFIDIQQMIRTLDPATMGQNPTDIAMMTEAKKLLSNISMSGGEYTSKALSWHMSINFMDKEENSLLQILNFVIRMNDANNAKGNMTASAFRMP